MRCSLGHHRLLTRFLIVSAAPFSLLVAGGCGSDGADDGAALDAAAQLIEGDLAGQIALGPLEATCANPTGVGLEPGDDFTCSATGAGDQVLWFTATVDDDGDGVQVRSKNVILAQQVDMIEAAASQQLALETGVPVEAGDLDCGDRTIVAVDGDTLLCEVRDPDDGTVYEAPVLLHDIDALVIDVSVGRAIR